MDRIGYDCIGGNAEWVAKNLPAPDIMFWYGTGSPGIQWTAEEKALFPHSMMVEIDQGGTGSPVPTAQVRDVENGAWPPSAAISKAAWHVTRPTLYGSRNTLAQCAADGWQGDFWLAWPGWNGEPLPVYRGITIIGVQDDWQPNYDKTTILDLTWPGNVPAPPAPQHVSVTVYQRLADAAWTSIEGASNYGVSYEGPGVESLTIVGNVSTVPAGQSVHAERIPIPGSHGGTLIITTSVKGVTVPIAHVSLP